MRKTYAAMLLCAAGVAFAGLGASHAAAQAVMMGKNPTECEISAALGVQAPGCPMLAKPGAKKPGTRGLAIGNIDQMPSSGQSAAPQAAPAAATEYRAAFQINFKFASDQLTEDAKQILDRIGAVMKAPDAGVVRFKIVGHTDGVGAMDSNQRLSEKRAAAVREYLVSNHGIASSRLTSAGMGARQLLNAGDPRAAENRRVEVINLGG
ncbi:OmpA-OmpF porin, OOP family [uncultured Gammaproteobacteria bacterium]